MKKDKKLTIEAVDAVVVFRADGTYEASLPNIAGDNIPEHLVMAASVVYALQDEDMIELLYEHLHKQCENLKNPTTLSLLSPLKSYGECS